MALSHTLARLLCLTPSSPHEYNWLVDEVVRTIHKEAPVDYALNATADILRAECFSQHVGIGLPLGTCIFRVDEEVYWWHPQRVGTVCDAVEYFKWATSYTKVLPCLDGSC